MGKVFLKWSEAYKILTTTGKENIFTSKIIVQNIYGFLLATVWQTQIKYFW